jgi:hypothetical protein
MLALGLSLLIATPALAGPPIGAAHPQTIEVRAPDGAIVGFVRYQHGRWEARTRDNRLLAFWNLAQLTTTDLNGKPLSFGNTVLKVVVDDARRKGLLPPE